MTEMEDDQLKADNNESPPETVMSEIQKLRSEIFEKLNKLSEIKDIAEQNYAENQKKLQSIQDFISKLQPEAVMESTGVVFPPNNSISLSANNATVKTPEIVKSFVLKHVFKNAEGFELAQQNFSEREDHFGVKWSICLIRRNSNLEFFLYVTHPEENWEIDTRGDLKIIGPNGTEFTKTMKCCFKENTGYGFPKFMEWEKMKKNYLVDGSLTTEIHVKIKETKGLRKEKFRSFDESVSDVSDMVLVVNDSKFYVHRTYLAAQSSFFKALFLGSFAESKKSEVTLTGIDPEDFHFFLEVLYGEAAIDDTNVEGIALLADMYDAPTAIRRCEEFMMKESKKSLKRKLQTADRYNLEALKKKCLSGITTLSNLKSIVPNNIKDLGHSTMAALLEKTVSIEP